MVGNIKFKNEEWRIIELRSIVGKTIKKSDQNVQAKLIKYQSCVLIWKKWIKKRDWTTEIASNKAVRT